MTDQALTVCEAEFESISGIRRCLEDAHWYAEVPDGGCADFCTIHAAGHRIVDGDSIDEGQDAQVEWRKAYDKLMGDD